MDNSTLSQEFLSSDDFLRIIQSLVCDIRQQFFISTQEFDLDYFGQTVIASKLTDQECLRLASNLSQMFGINFNLISADTFSSLAKKAYNLWQKSKKTVTFATSGSTGTPKLCCHAALDLFEEAQSITPLIYKPKRVLVTVPIHHLYGFTFGLILPKLLSLPTKPIIALPSIICDQAQSTDLVVTMPLLLKKMSLLESDFKACQVISATMPLDAEAAKFLQSRQIPLLEIFGSSETSVLGTRTAHTEPFTLRPYFEIDSEKSAVTRKLACGKTHTYPLQDKFFWSTNRTFFPKGRLDTAIQIGGVNVYPEKIVAYLCNHPKVKTCSVRLDQNLGRLKAFIVLKDGLPTKDLRQELRLFVKEGLTSFEQPIRFDFGSQLPQNTLGKFVDW
ncbi:MAG: AMP-binding protein [Desulfovibrionaceae bacterium]|nr:AMP-binding protein [Desulfovibrionaceae bacterium]